MILFSTILNISDTLTKEAFIQLVLRWNEESRYEENIVPGIRWNGEYNVKYGTENLSLEFVYEPEREILAVRHEKVAHDAVIWDTDYVVNFRERRMAIRLDRTYREDAMTWNGVFSTPHFITLLIEEGVLADDHDLPVLRTPVEITESMNLSLPEEKGEKMGQKLPYQLPVIEVHKAADGSYPLSTEWLASRVKGAAHVVVRTNFRKTEADHQTGRREEPFGAVYIYYPVEGISPRKFIYRSESGNRKKRLENVIGQVIRYWNLQRMDMLYTWHGVNNAILNDSLNRQIIRCQEAEDERENAESAKDHALREIDQVYETFDEDLKRMQRKLEELTAANEALTFENSSLRAKVHGSDAMPLLYQGAEEELYPDEMKDIVLETLNESLKNTERLTRRADVLEDVIAHNEYEHLAEKKKQKIKTIFKGYKSMTSVLRQELLDMGFTITEEGKHYKLTYKNDPRYMITIAKTPSDTRAGSNNAARINRKML